MAAAIGGLITLNITGAYVWAGIVALFVGSTAAVLADRFGVKG